MEVFVYLMILTFVSNSFELKCFKKGDPGTVTVSKSPFLRVGDSIDVFCTIDPNHKEVLKYNWTSTNLVIEKQPDGTTMKDIKVLNSTTISVSLNQVQYDVDTGSYTCLAPLPSGKSKAICTVKLLVGYEPQPVKNFHCTSYNWANLTCTWDAPPNNIPTKYSVYYSVPTPNAIGTGLGCPVTPKVGISSCTWTEETQPWYNIAYDPLYFNIIGTNALVDSPVRVLDYYKFEHFKNMIPDKPSNLNPKSIGVDYIVLEWKIPSILTSFEPGIYHKISYSSAFGSDDLGIISGLDPHSGTLTYNITGLKYPFTQYKIEVQSCSGASIANVSSILWSEPAAIIVETKPKTPNRPPLTTVGSFELINYGHTSRTVYIYWEQLKYWEKNGPDFHYNVSVYVNDEYSPLQPSVILDTFAKFENIDKTSDYKFFITSTNIEGSSKDSSFLGIPVLDQIIKPPQAFTRIDYGKGVFELSWKHNVDNSAENYTVYWCEDTRDRPYQCNGQLSWESVPASLTALNVTVDPSKIYQFALSADKNWTSSGMVWASCVILHNQVTGQLKEVWTKDIGSDSISVAWRMECSDKIGVILGYKVYYCRTGDHKNCLDQKQYKTFSKDDSEGTIAGLLPYTEYILSAAVLARAGESQTSDPLYAKTLMGAPSDPPYNLEAKEIGPHHIWLSWFPPLVSNGILQQYKLKLVMPGVSGSRITYLDSNATEVKIDNLKSWSFYELAISACTGQTPSDNLMCSEYSESLLQKTGIGSPGPVSAPDVRFPNQSMIMISWDPPLDPGGPIDHYNVLVNITSNEAVEIRSTMTYALDAVIEVPDCQVDKDQYFLASVQAINVVDNVSMPGVWSPVTKQNCVAAGLSKAQIAAIATGSVLFIIMLFLFLLFVYKKGKEQLDSLKNIKVVLPPATSFGDKKQGLMIRETEFLSRNNNPAIVKSLSQFDVCSKKECDGDSGKSSVSSATSRDLLQGDQNDSGHESMPSSDKSLKKTYKSIDKFSLSDEPVVGYAKAGIQPKGVTLLYPGESINNEYPQKCPSYMNVDTKSGAAGEISPTVTPDEGYSQVDIQEPEKPDAFPSGYVTLSDINNEIVPVSAPSSSPKPVQNSPYMVVDGWGSSIISPTQCPPLTVKQDKPVNNGYISWNTACNSISLQPASNKQLFSNGNCEYTNV